MNQEAFGALKPELGVWNNSRVIVYNLCSYIEGYPQLDLVPYASEIPAELMLHCDENDDFDRAYAEYVIANHTAFRSLMSVIYPIYEDPDTLVIILYYETYYYHAIMESIISLIKNRYGYYCYIVDEAEDALECLDDISFTPFGLLNLDQDVIRYATLTGAIDQYAKQ
jgi:hypothetical protein